MEHLNNLYKLRDSLIDNGISVPSDLVQRIAAEEERIINGRLNHFYDAAHKLMVGIKSPMSVTVDSDPKTGVVVSINPIASTPSKKEQMDNVESGFKEYLNGLDISKSSIESYKRALDDDLIVDLLSEYAGVLYLEKVKDLEIIDEIIEHVPTKRYKGGFPHAMLGHYRNYLLLSEESKTKDDIPTRSRTIPNRGLAVVFSDGTIINEKQASETLRQTVMKIGAKTVQQLGLTVCGIPFISDKKSDNANYSRAQKPVGDGLYVMTCSDTPTKQKQLEEIANRLNLKLRVAIK